MSLYLASLSFLHFYKCLLMFTAFLIRQYISSGISGALPLFLKSLTIFCPVSSLMLGTAYLSLIITPIWEGDMPFLAIVTIKSTMVLGVWETHLGDLLLKGVTVELIPLPLPLHCILPIFMVFLNINILIF